MPVGERFVIPESRRQTLWPGFLSFLRCCFSGFWSLQLFWPRWKRRGIFKWPCLWLLALALFVVSSANMYVVTAQTIFRPRSWKRRRRCRCCRRCCCCRCGVQTSRPQTPRQTNSCSVQMLQWWLLQQRGLDADKRPCPVSVFQDAWVFFTQEVAGETCLQM